MRLREYLISKLAEVWGFDLVGFSFAFLVTFVLAILDKTLATLIFLAIALFFLGYFVARQVHTPPEEKPNIGLNPMTSDEFARWRKERE